MSWPKAKVVVDMSRNEARQKRRLNSALRDLDVLKTRKERNMARVEMEVKKDLSRLNGDKHRLQREKAQAREGNTASRHRLKAYMYVPLTTAVMAASPKKHSLCRDKDKQSPGNRKISITMKSTTQEQDGKPQMNNLLPKISPQLPRMSLIKGERSKAVKVQDRISQSCLSAQNMATNGIGSLTLTDGRRGNTSSERQRRNSADMRQGRRNSATMRDRQEGSGRMNASEANKLYLSQVLSKHNTANRTSVDEVATPVSLPDDVITFRNLGKSNEEIWKDLEDCRYLRGHEPEEHRLISELGPNKYVYGVTYEERYDELRVVLVKELEETRRRRQAEADVASYMLASVPAAIEEELSADSLDLQQYKEYVKRML